MVNYLKAEILKQKHSFNNMIIWLIPIVNIIISFLLMGPEYIQSNSYNWWYVLFLPFISTFIASSIVKKDRKYNNHGLFGIVKDKKKIWYSKITIATLYLAFTCFIFFLFTVICGRIFNEQIPLASNLLASVLLFVTFAWQIPFFLFVTLKFNMFLSIILSMVCNLWIACMCGVESYWWIPFAIPARLMCPVINVLPNGLLLSADNPLNNTNVILVGVIITIILYIVLSFSTAKIFENQEI